MKIFIKWITPFLLLVTFLSFCNNNEEPVIKQADMPAKEKELREAITKYPDSALLKETLIQYFEDNGNIDVALAETNKAISKYTANPRLWDKKAALYLLKDDTTNAIKAYETAIAIFPEPQYIMSVGWLYAKTKNIKALEMADALLLGQKARAQREALLIKGLYFNTIGDNNKAILFFNNCLAIDYTYMFAYREKAIVLYEMGKYEEAIAVLNKAVTLQNGFDEGYYWLGKCYEKLKNTDAAIDNYRKAVLYNADFFEAKDALAKLGVK